MDNKMIWQQKQYDKDREAMLVKQGKGKLLSRLLSQRNIDPDDADSFISSDYKNISHPYALNDCEKAARLFCQIAKENGKVGVIGDYDADGIISSVMIRELCNVFKLDCLNFLPSRLEQGYGLTKATVDAFLEKARTPIDLLFVVDCGTNSKNEIKMLYEAGVKHIIIIDHHLPSETIATNADALLSWHLSKSQEMCSCGQIFQFIRGIRWLTKKVNPIEFLTYAAIGTIADVSPVIGDNRIIIKNGLSEYARSHVLASGLSALIKQSKIHTKTITQHDISFKIAPKINAVGRIFNPDIVFGLLVERDPDIADNTAEYVVGYNEERKKIQKKIEEEAVQMASLQKTSNGILLFSEGWHIGVVGIVASKIVEIYNKPAVIVGKFGEKCKGSGRSVKGVNLKEILDTCPELFETYGGHAGAVGVTLKKDMISKAGKIFDKACKKYYKEKAIPKENVNYFDARIDIPLIIPKTSFMLRNNLYPYCDEMNEEPVFLLPESTIMDVSVSEAKNKSWRLMTFFIERNGVRCQYPFKFFTKKYGTDIEGRKADILFTFPQNDDFESSRWSQFELMATDILLKDKKENS